MDCRLAKFCHHAAITCIVFLLTFLFFSHCLTFQNGHFETVQYLFERGGAEVNQLANNGATPVALADNNGHHEVVQYLIERAGADASRAQMNGFTPLIASSQKEGSIDVLRFLAERKDQGGDTLP